MTGKIWIGADPGGLGNFGVAILQGGQVITKCVDHTDAAVQFVCSVISKTTPAGIGVDAPLWWCSGRSSDRRADQWIRETYGLSGGQVQTANSLRGSALVQGALFVERMREKYPDVPVTESHPKALLVAIDSPSWDKVCEKYQLDFDGKVKAEHERDAALAAIAAREGFEGRWTIDLSKNRLTSEQDPSAYWLKPVHYYWPSRQKQKS